MTTPPPPNSPEEAWHDVGQQFKILGDSLASALSAAWKDEHNRQRVIEMQAGLQAMVETVGKVIEEKAASPEAAHLRQEVEKTASAVHEAGTQAVQEARPHLIAALRQVNHELQKMIEHMEPQTPSAPDGEDRPTGS